jgi:hypothetical protein
MAGTLIFDFNILPALVRFDEDVGYTLDDFVVTIAMRIEAEAKTLIQQGNPTGRTYKRGAIKKPASQRLLGVGLRPSRTSPGRLVAGYYFHRASAPGEPPATDTGHLANMIGVSQEMGDQVNAVVNFNAAYSSLLETGTTRMAARPYIQRAIDLALDLTLPSL